MDQHYKLLQTCGLEECDDEYDIRVDRHFQEAVPAEYIIPIQKWRLRSRESMTVGCGGGLPQTALAGPHTGKPQLQTLMEMEQLSNVVLENDEFIAMVPPNRGTSPGSTVLSDVHLIVFPKHKRVYNAVTLATEDWPWLRAMRSFGSSALRVLAAKPATFRGSLLWSLDQIRRQHDVSIDWCSPEADSILTRTDVMPLEATIETCFHDRDDSEAYFQLYPSGHDGYLRLHVISHTFKRQAFLDLNKRALRETQWLEFVRFQDVLTYVIWRPRGVWSQGWAEEDEKNVAPQHEAVTTQTTRGTMRRQRGLLSWICQGIRRSGRSVTTDAT